MLIAVAEQKQRLQVVLLDLLADHLLQSLHLQHLIGFLLSAQFKQQRLVDPLQRSHLCVLRRIDRMSRCLKLTYVCFALGGIRPNRAHRLQTAGICRIVEIYRGTVNMEISTLRMILKAHKLWSAIQDEVRMLPERKKIGKALTADQARNLLNACHNSPQPSLYTAVVIFCNTALRNAELRRARWHQVDFLRAEFQVGEAKTEESAGRIIPLNATALEAFKAWKARWPDAKPEDYIFPSEKLRYRGTGSVERRLMTPYATDLSKPLGSWKTAWKTAQSEAGVHARIHDLRHHAITILAESQTPISTIKAISGHMSAKMVEHYSHVRDEARRKAVELLDSLNERPVQ